MILNPLSAEHEALMGLALEGKGIARHHDRLMEKAGANSATRLSSSQQRMWFIDQLSPGTGAYNISRIFMLSGPLNRSALIDSLAGVVARHHVLRACYRQKHGSPMLFLADTNFYERNFHDLSSLDKKNREAQLKSLLEGEANRPFDLANGPIFRANIVRSEEHRHFLQLVIHHIAVDQWSLDIIDREISRLYSAFLTQQAPKLLDVRYQYSDYAHWEAQHLTDNYLAPSIEYWCRQLSDLPDKLPLGQTTVCNANSSNRQSGTVSLVRPLSVDELVTRFSIHENTTRFTIYLAVFKALLALTSGQADVLVATPSNNRTREEFEDIVGFFANTIIVRSQVNAENGFISLVTEVGDTVVSAMVHQELPLERIIKELAIARPEQGLSLLQSMFVLVNSQEPPLALEGLTVESIDHALENAKFDLVLQVDRKSYGVVVSIQYDSDIFDQVTAESLLNQYAALLDATIESPSVPLLSHWHVSDTLHQGRLNRAAGQTDIHDSVADVFRDLAAQYPGKSAVQTPIRAITYRQLDQRSDQIAAVLSQYDDKIVGLVFDAGIEMIAGMLACLKANKIYVPIDRGYPPERKKRIGENAGVGIVLFDQQVEADTLVNQSPKFIVAINVSDIPTTGPVYTGLITETNAYILYTSGTTGIPKGILQSQRNLLYFNRSYIEALGIGPQDNILAPASFGCDASVMDIFAALLSGATLCVLNITQDNLNCHLNYIVSHRITLYHSTPSVFKYLFANELVGNYSEIFQQIRAIVLGGEASDNAAINLAKQKFNPNCLFVNGYGPSESTLAMQRRCEIAALDHHLVANLGQAIPGTRILLENTQRCEAPVGEVGQIVIESPYVALGYWKDAPLTKKHFVPRPDGTVRYYTGDFGRKNIDGSIDYVGRQDRQLKIRGHRVELQEIESQVNHYPGVRSTIVLPMEHDDQCQLVAYYIWDYQTVSTASECLALLNLDTGTELAAKERSTASLEAAFIAVLNVYLAERLPQYMIPAAFIRIEHLPLNHHGKLEVDALPVPMLTRLSTKRSHPTTTTQKRLLDLWSTRLGIEIGKIGIRDDFFALGGNSLLAMSLVGDACYVFQVEINVSQFFDTPTVEGMALAVEYAKTGHVITRHAPPQEEARAAPGKLSNEQQQLWLTQQLESFGAHYHLPLLYKIEGQVDVDSIETALRKIVTRHQVLRSVILQQSDGTARCVLLAAKAFNITRLAAVGKGDMEFSRQIQCCLNQPFDLSKDFLIRATYITLDERQRFLFIVVHHMAADSWSMNLLQQFFFAEMNADGNADTETQRRVHQYADYTDWQTRRLTPVQTERQLRYWQKQLANSPPVHNLRVLSPRSEDPDYSAAYEQAMLAPELCERLHVFAQQQGITLFMLVHGAFCLLLSRYSQSRDIVVGTPVANRPRRQFENLVGFFVNTLVLRVDCNPEQSVNAFLESLKMVNMDALAYQDVSFEQVVERLNPPRSNYHRPLFQIMLGMDIPTPKVQRVGGARFIKQSCHTGHAKYELSLFITEDEGGLALEFEYRSQLFSQLTIAMMSRHLETILSNMVENNERAIGHIPMLSPEDQAYLVEQLNRRAVLDIPLSQTADELIKQQVEVRPDALALVFGAHSYSYRQFDNWANTLVGLLVAQGVGRGDLVGISLPSSPALFAAMYAVMKLPGTYIPIDPGYPLERVRSIVSDSGMGAVITQASFAAHFPDLPVLLLSESELTIAPKSSATFERNNETEHAKPPPIYVIYTSGSTGKPKGVQITHAAAVNLVCGMLRTLDISAGKTWLQLASVSFDIAFFEWVACLASGGRCVIANEGERMDAQALLQLIENQAIDVMQATPSRWRQLLSCGWPVERELLALTAGEALTEDLVQLLKRHPLTVWNCYGPTEATIYATAKRICGPGVPDRAISIGRGLPGYTHYVCDNQGQLLPFGVMGELYLGGVGLAEGYLNQEALSKCKFVPDPWSNRVGARLYRTGDQVYYRDDGELAYVGRNDHQVKYRGYRIELGEIEYQLTQFPMVSGATVLLENPHSETPLLRAFIQMDSTANTSPATVIDMIRRSLAATLPYFMLPHDFQVLGELPLTPNGKVDREALLALNTKRQSSPHVAPESPAEILLVSIWENLLDRETIGLRDNFFALGGQSLLAVKILSRIESIFKLKISLREFFSNPTIQGMLEILEANVDHENHLDEVAQVYALVSELSTDEVKLFLQEAQEGVGF